LNIKFSIFHSLKEHFCVILHTLKISCFLIKNLHHLCALLSNLGKLHSNIRNLIERVGKATAEESSIARQSRSERDHALLAQLFERNALKEKQALLAELAKPSYQDDFLKRFGNSFCQICSYDDTFSDDDFFIYCEVI